MLLIIAFCIYAIVKKRVAITRNWTLTGDNARNFGIAMLVLLISVNLITATLAAMVAPDAIAHPILGRIVIVVALAAVALLLAWAVADDKPAPSQSV